MVTEQLRIFVASPGDCAEEREIVRSAVELFNALSDDITFVIHGWEEVAGTARRPQEAINDLVKECDFCIVLFRESWGSDPGGRGFFSSGTEEEVFVALTELAKRDGLIRDVWIAFCGNTAVSPEIAEFKQKLIDSKGLLFEQIPEPGALREKVARRLSGWAENLPKVPRTVSLIPTSGRDVIGVAKLVSEGWVLFSSGYPEMGLARLEEASVAGGLSEAVQYARGLSRVGQLSKAKSQLARVLDEHLTMFGLDESPAIAEALALRASLERRSGDAKTAQVQLRQALVFVKAQDPYTQKTRCRILDDLGLIAQQSNDFDDARRLFEESLDIRKDIGNPVDVTQSLVNAARLENAVGDSARALELADEAETCLTEIPPAHIHANVALLLAQTKLRLGDAQAAIDHAGMSYVLNEQLKSDYGKAMALNVRSQCQKAQGDLLGAIATLEECLELNQSSNDARGEALTRRSLSYLREEIDS